MRQLYKHIIVGLITASFVYSPLAFAAPNQTKLKKDVNRVLNVVKKSKGGVKLSQMVESMEPMLRKRVYRKMVKDALPFWDRKLSRVTIGQDYVKLTYNGRSMFARYVDRGSIAFIVNNKPLLWKDFLTYDKTVNRLSEILVGRSVKKVSFLDKLKSFFSTEAIARDDGASDVDVPRGDSGPNSSGKSKKEDDCLTKNRTLHPDGNRCGACVEGFVPEEPHTEEDLLKNGSADLYCIPPETPIPDNQVPDVTDPVPNEPEEEGGRNWMPLLLIGGALLFFLLMMRKNKDKDDDDDDDDDKPDEPTEPEPPVTGWTPEGSCPTPGARGLTEADLPPQCRQSSCGADGVCTEKGSGSVDGGSPTGY